MMIEFNCLSCGREFKVSYRRIGQKGSCPTCRGAIEVPMKSDFRSPSETGLKVCKDPELQRIFNEIRRDRQMQDVITEYKVQADRVTLEVAIKVPAGRRSQTVFIETVEVPLRDGSLEKQLMVFSYAGVIDEFETAAQALLMAHSMQWLNISLNEEKVLIVCYLERTRGINISDTIGKILSVALAADKLEEEIFRWDIS
jgi:hypothetical protein